MKLARFKQTLNCQHYKPFGSYVRLYERKCVSIIDIYIFIALALDESIILDVLQFPMQNIYQSCDLGHAIGRRNVNASQ